MTGGDDEGSAIVEFVFLAVLMLVPIVYLVLVLGRVQAGALAVEQGVREAGRAFVSAGDEQSAMPRAYAAATIAYRDQGFGGPTRDELSVECRATPCLTAEARVVVHGSVTVDLPGVPRFLAGVLPLHVTVRATHTATVDAFAR
jgi:Flp pilus assembly protein TadG